MVATTALVVAVVTRAASVEVTAMVVLVVLEVVVVVLFLDELLHAPSTTAISTAATMRVGFMPPSSSFPPRASTASSTGERT